MKSIVFDTGPIISLTTNNLLWLLEPLKDRFKGEFFITNAVKNELVDRPMETKRFKFEAIQVLENIDRKTINVLNDIDLNNLKQKTLELLDLANTIFNIDNNWMKIVHYAEIEALAACIHLNANAYVVDERTTRVLIENPKRMAGTLEGKLHKKVKINWQNIRELQKITKNVKIIRSVDLVAVAYELGMLDKYLVDIPNPKKTLLESVLWGVKIHGCSVSRREIENILSLEKVS